MILSPYPSVFLFFSYSPFLFLLPFPSLLSSFLLFSSSFYYSTASITFLLVSLFLFLSIQILVLLFFLFFMYFLLLFRRTLRSNIRNITHHHYDYRFVSVNFTIMDKILSGINIVYCCWFIKFNRVSIDNID